MNTPAIELAKMAVSQLSARDRQEFIRTYINQPSPIEPDRIRSIQSAADRLGKTKRTVFNLLKSGALTRIKLPGRVRGCGVRESELTALIEGGAQ